MYKILLRSTDRTILDESESLTRKDATAKAAYMISDDYARGCGTTHRELGTYKVEIEDADGDVVLEQFR